MITITSYLIKFVVVLLSMLESIQTKLETYLGKMKLHNLELAAKNIEIELNLNFAPHFGDPEYGKLGRSFFANGYGISVGTGKGHYCTPFVTYEIAVIHGNDDHFDLIYDTPITNDVLGHQTWQQVIDTARLIAALPIRSN